MNYPYSAFHHNQKVLSCEIDGTKITNAKISIDEDGWVYICQNEIDGSSAGDNLGYEYSWRTLYKDEYFKEGRCCVTNLILDTKPTWETLKKGDVLEGEDGEITVLETLGEVIFCHHSDDEEQEPFTYSITELKSRGYTIKDSQPESDDLQKAIDLLNESGKYKIVKK